MRRRQFHQARHVVLDFIADPAELPLRHPERGQQSGLAGRVAAQHLVVLLKRRLRKLNLPLLCHNSANHQRRSRPCRRLKKSYDT